MKEERKRGKVLLHRHEGSQLGLVLPHSCCETGEESRTETRAFELTRTLRNQMTISERTGKRETFGNRHVRRRREYLKIHQKKKICT